MIIGSSPLPSNGTIKNRVQSIVVLAFVFLMCAGLERISYSGERTRNRSGNVVRLESSTPMTDGLRRNLMDIVTNRHSGTIPPYGQVGIQSLWYNIKASWPLLFVFDGNHFKVFTLGHWKMSFRYVKLVPLLVHALQTNHPERFQPGQPVFQMVFTVSDTILTSCANRPDLCPFNNFFPPIVSFSTVYRDDSILPSAKSFPNPEYSRCMYDVKVKGRLTCDWQQVDQNLNFENLINQIVWRGSDYEFLRALDRYRLIDRKSVV